MESPTRRRSSSRGPPEDLHMRCAARAAAAETVPELHVPPRMETPSSRHRPRSRSRSSSHSQRLSAVINSQKRDVYPMTEASMFIVTLLTFVRYSLMKKKR